ncbi:MAG: CsgG/HfaB family protein [Candidatus Theseobacter exili]|nr:CsgG/HfaB family protein [Candidatus Theseobacter exili]
MRKVLFYSILASIILTVFQTSSFSDDYSDKTYEFDNRRYVKKIKSLLKNNQSVVIAIIGDNFSCNATVITDKNTRDIFVKNLEQKSLNLVSKPLINKKYFSDNPDFAVVDRSSVEKILNEHKFQQTGFVTKKIRTQLGEMLGVTHLLMVSGSRTTFATKPKGYSYTDERTTKLIDMKLGKILTMEAAYCHKINDRYTKWTIKEIHSTDLNDYSFFFDYKFNQPTPTNTYKRPTRRRYY